MVAISRGPGVYTPEIEGPPTISGSRYPAAGFVGLAREGPAGLASGALTSLADFEARHGTPEPGDAGHLWHAARAFFRQGGERLHVARVLAAADCAAGLEALADVSGIGIVAAPGLQASEAEANAAADALIRHAEDSGRFALIDGVADQPVAALRAWRRRFDTRDAALYYPWLETDDSEEGAVTVAPSAFVAGAIATVDRERGMWEAPANIALEAATPARMVTTAELDALNLEGINIIRALPGRGTRVWGARTMSGDPEWRYVSTRRWLRWIEGSIAAGLDWVVFEPNSEACWARVRGAVANFLIPCWREGGLMGAKAEEAFFVRCDRTTMTQDDIDRGRLVCLTGVAPLRPAEFVILRIVKATRP